MHRYDRALDWVLDHQALTLLVALATLVLTVLLYLDDPEGPVPDPGHRPAAGAHRGRAGRLVRAHGGAAAGRRAGDPAGPGGREPELVRRRRRGQQHDAAHRQHADQPEAGRGNQQATMDRLRERVAQGRRRHALPAADAGPDDRRRDRPDPVPRLARRRRQRDRDDLDGQAGRAAADRPRRCATSAATPARRAWRPSSTSTATPRRACRSPRARSTTRSTARSASASSRRSSPRPTSTA